MNCSTAIVFLCVFEIDFNSNEFDFLLPRIFEVKTEIQNEGIYSSEFSTKGKYDNFVLKNKKKYYRNESGGGMLIPETKIVLRWILRQTKFWAIICLAFETHKIQILRWIEKKIEQKKWFIWMKMMETVLFLMFD